MKRIKRLPVKIEMEPSKVIFIEKQHMESLPDFSENEKILKKASAFLTDFHQENIGSEKLARHLGISIRKLQRITHEELDATPTNFIYLVKLNLAAEFLKSRKGNVSETAYEYGFSDPAYFSKLFKKHFGMSPVEYMERNDNDQER
jgi:AraC-like DNA-binding protein